MAVSKNGEEFMCEVCGNEVIVTQAGGGTLVCCDKEMVVKEGTEMIDEEEKEKEEKEEEKEPAEEPEAEQPEKSEETEETEDTEESESTEEESEEPS